ncbi:MAG: 7-cyano-7-deazaguanine synthase QueC [Candidatus Omnitrophica bacterium]|nr:7-cyano-7-deazaguanine synthase QueC [Candidatus Omnitrophota bacterium]
MPALRTGLRSAVILLSGGLDSAVALYLAREQDYRLHALSFDYGQRHCRELKSAEAVADEAGAIWRAVKISLPWGGSALTDEKVAVPTPRPAEKMRQEIPVTYVPARNTIFLSFAASWAEVVGAGAIFIGANSIDFSGYPDCRPEYFEHFHELIRAGTRAGTLGRAPEIAAPLVNMTKADIVREGQRLGVPFEITWSCYRGGEAPCENCEACALRARGFEEAGIADPLVTRSVASR